MDTIAVIMTTCAREGPVGDLRAGYARRAIAALKNLHYDGPIWLHFADDGSRPGHLEHLISWARRARAWTDITVSNAEGLGVGKSINLALDAVEPSDLIFYLQDDIVLVGELDLTIPARHLQDESIGMVRTGMIHPGLHAETRYAGSELQYYWVIDKAHSGYSFTFRTWLAHRRFFRAYGPLPTSLDLYNTERVYNEHVRNTDGPDIAYAGNVQLNHPWEYIGETACDGTTRGGGRNP